MPSVVTMFARAENLYGVNCNPAPRNDVHKDYLHMSKCTSCNCQRSELAPRAALSGKAMLECTQTKPASCAVHQARREQAEQQPGERCTFGVPKCVFGKAMCRDCVSCVYDGLCVCSLVTLVVLYVCVPPVAVLRFVCAIERCARTGTKCSQHSGAT